MAPRCGSTQAAGRFILRVLGTEFNVRCYQASDMHITLVHGRVQVNQGARQVVLRPGDDAQPTNKCISVHQVDTDNCTSWREGLIFYDDVTLRDILLQLGRWYNLNIICTNPDVLDKHFHYIYDRNADVKNTLQTLTESSNVGIELKDQSLYIY